MDCLKYFGWVSTVNGIEYQAEEGMTREEWCNSEYNVDEFLCFPTCITTSYGLEIIGPTPSGGLLSQRPSYVICNGCAYAGSSAGGGTN